MGLHKNFRMHERVKVTNTDSEVDGYVGYILGLSQRHIVDHYIVGKFENILPMYIADWNFGYPECLSLPEVCIERMDSPRGGLDFRLD